jgi:hypothetical protein
VWVSQGSNFVHRGKGRVKHVANMRERIVRVLVGNPDAKRLFVRPRRRWEDNTKVVLQGVAWRRRLKLCASGHGQVVCSFECGKGNSGSIKR